MEVSNRSIFVLWYQGFENAPPLVRACLDSWRRFNRDWNVVALDKNNIHDFIALKDAIDLTRTDIPVQKISAISRLCLLRRYGGVWADATVFCMRPLDDWLSQYFSIGFAAFRSNQPDRFMANWFIAAEKDNPILIGLDDAFLDFMNRPRFPNQYASEAAAELERLKPILCKDIASTTGWFAPGLIERIGAHPYLIFHYTFNKLLLDNPALLALWQRGRPLDIAPAERLQGMGRKNHLARALAHLERDEWFVQKLNWRVDVASPYWSTVLARLVELRPRTRAAAAPPAAFASLSS